VGCTENSPEEVELAALTDVTETYERERWKLFAAHVIDKGGPIRVLPK